MGKIYPSLLAASPDAYEKMIKLLEPLVPGFHIDIMDQHFVPHEGISIEKANALAQLTYRQMWIHLMVEHPEQYLPLLHLPPDTIVTFHIESNQKTLDLIKQITEKKWLPGIALNPNTPISEVFPFLGSLYQVLIMSVNPGMSGQPFIDSVLSKIEPLLTYRNNEHAHFKIAIDGGITLKNISMISHKGIDDFAIGSEIFSAKTTPLQAYTSFAEQVD